MWKWTEGSRNTRFFQVNPRMFDWLLRTKASRLEFWEKRRKICLPFENAQKFWMLIFRALIDTCAAINKRVWWKQRDAKSWRKSCSYLLIPRRFQSNSFSWNDLIGTNYEHSSFTFAQTLVEHFSEARSWNLTNSTFFYQKPPSVDHPPLLLDCYEWIKAKFNEQSWFSIKL